MPSTVLLDANLLRHAEPWRFPDSDAHPAQRSTITMPPYGAVAAEPRGALGSSHAWLTSQLDAIPRIGEFARKGHIKCFVSELVMLELTDQPRGRHATGMLGDFRDVRFEEVPPPLPLPAEITDSQIPWTTRRDRITRWLQHCSDERFVELKSALQSPMKDNKLIDLFHVYSAETAGLDYFVTADKKSLVERLREQTKVSLGVDVVYPSELISRLT